MTSRRATQRQRANAPLRLIAIVLADRSEASVDGALRQAHQAFALQPQPHTQVALQLHDPARGLELLAPFGDHAVAVITAQIAQHGGETPTIAIATRITTRTFHHERHNR